MGCSEPPRKCQELDIRYNGAPITYLVLEAVAVINAKIPVDCKRVIHQIEAKHGRDVISGGHAKLRRIVRDCERQAPELDFSRSLRFVFGGILFSLDTKLASPKLFSLEVLTGLEGFTKIQQT